MDLLESLNVPVLPEQQTCINTKVSSALQSNPDIRLGFDACCTCAAPLSGGGGTGGSSPSSKKGKQQKDVPCKGCKRVWYCSKKCRDEDANALAHHSSSGNHYGNTNNAAAEEDGAMGGDQAQGHSSIICALLRICQIDDDIEEKDPDDDLKEQITKITKKEKDEAQLRISSEYESYPATLTNTIMDAPCCQPILETHSLPPKRSSKHHKLHNSNDNTNTNNSYEQQHHSLTIHIVGASEEAELWGDFDAKANGCACEDVYSAYAEALTELVLAYRGITTINLIFIGPNCPKKNLHMERVIDLDGSSGDGEDSHNNKKRKRSGSETETTPGDCKIIMETHRCNYDSNYLKHGPQHVLAKSSSKKKNKKSSSSSSKPPPKADIIMFFNPGLTCPDYSWHDAFGVVGNTNTKKIPFIVTTNTEMEAISDLQWLHQRGFIDSLPSAVADILNDGIVDHDVDHDAGVEFCDSSMMFFGENPNAGIRVRQSGNMANDLFVKNRWIFGGVFSDKSGDGSDDERKSKGETILKSESTKPSEGMEGKKKKKRGKSKERKKKGKKKNAALM